MLDTLLGGVSQCEYITFQKILIVRGWFLPTDLYDNIAIYRPGRELIGRAKVGMSRPDVQKQYPEHDEPNSGWRFEGEVEGIGEDTKLTICLEINGECVHEASRVVKLDRTTELAVEELKKHYNVAGVKGAPVDYPRNRDELAAAGFDVIDQPVDRAAYDAWMAKIDYPGNFPFYTKTFGKMLHDKSLQHFLSLESMQLTPESVYMDVASSISVFPDILKKFYGLATVWRQDMEYERGIHDDKIGSFGSSIPLDDASLDAIALHCSLEHFEGDEDVKFFAEAHRLLKPGGRLCVIPLYTANELSITTSPSVWASKYKSYDDIPNFDKRATIFINDHKSQRQQKLYDAATLRSDLLLPFSDRFEIKIIYYPNYTELTGCPSFNLMMTKK